MPKGRSGIITEEFKGKENTAYHDVEKLFKIYRSVNWKMQIKINQVKRHFQLEYVSENEVQVTNNLFTRKMTDDCGHIVIVEKPGYIHEIRIPDVLGFCTVKEGGEIEYYRNADG